ncbi:tripartite tricarboxylate transporter TctB family protein [Methylobrevis albus]|uniref:Tripartite tricarboxylate transporter TctB family protein n=1 Tax=Methylobrevis albus TaxID=2793297 RepID=A0A931I3X2_9HYPH|nr:tripartite tricarboxylate transporter TctB family protein [Methylobrevis albus]MBH0238801.1 tripartite tricarboxylate transporter TctB family protein [Methylobrevis albus]
MIEIRLRTAEIVTAILLLLGCAFLFWNTFSLPPSPMRGYPGAGFMPRLILGYTAVFIVFWLARRVRADGRDEPAEPFELRAYLVTLASVFGFVLLLGTAGFEAASFAVLLALLGPRMGNWLLAAAVAAGTTLILWAVFVLFLNVSLPVAFLPRFISF